MRICFYSPYVPKHLGGGEKYLLDCAQALSQEHQVFVATSNQALSNKELNEARSKYETYFGLDLSRVEFITTPLGTDQSFLKKLFWTRQWDVLYYLTDGSFFWSLAQRNVLHIQFPLKIDKSSWLEQVKLSQWHVKNTNSFFTKSVVEPAWPVAVDLVHWPLIETPAEKPDLSKKEKSILHVGRFFRQLHTKRQDVLIDIFRELHQQPAAKGWKLYLVGAVEDQAYFRELQQQAAGLPIEFKTELSRAELLDHYRRASIYWHATGFGIDEQEHPEKVEHFGISTVEAMSNGCVPIVINKGGQPEVLGPRLADWLWQTHAECLELTIRVINNQELRQQAAQEAVLRATVFGKERFSQQLQQMIGA